MAQSSSSCLMQAIEGNPLHAAWGESVSFGRFATETLAWEKWSSFNQNRYLEEVEKYSKPGSVAQKKAYFEAHYKRKREAALLEQENAANDLVQNASGTGLNLEAHDVTANEENESNLFDDKAVFTDHVEGCNSMPEVDRSDINVVIDEHSEFEVNSNKAGFSTNYIKDSSYAVVLDLEITDVKEADPVNLIIDKQILVEIPVESKVENQQEDYGENRVADVDISITKKTSIIIKDLPASKVEMEFMKTGTLSSNSSVPSRASKIIPSSPARPQTPGLPRKESSSTPHTMRTVLDSLTRPKTPVLPTKKSNSISCSAKSLPDCPARPKTPVLLRKENSSTASCTKTVRNCPARPRTPVLPRKENSSTPHGTKNVLDCPIKPRTPVLPQKEISYTPHSTMTVRDCPARPTTPVLPRKETSASPHGLKTVRNCPTRPRTPVNPWKENGYTPCAAMAIRNCPARPKTPVLPQRETSATPHGPKSVRDFPGRPGSPLFPRNESSSTSQNTKTLLDCPARPQTPVLFLKENSFSSRSTHAVNGSADKHRLTPKSLHMSINLTSSSSLAVEANKQSSPFLERMKTKDCSTPAQTPVRTCAKVLPMPRPVTPKREISRIKKTVEHEVGGSKKMDMKLQSLSMDRSRSSSSCGKSCSPVGSSPFSFRSDDRAIKRKEYSQKQEEKLSIKEAQKMDLQAKSKEKADAEIKRLQQSLRFKATPMPNFYRETESSKNHIKKLPLTRPISPKLGRKPVTVTLSNTCSLPPRIPSTKTESSSHAAEHTSGISATRSLSSVPKTNYYENASPNIQN